MWLLIILICAWCFVASIEYLHWLWWEVPRDLAIQQAYLRQAYANMEILVQLDNCMALAESLYESTSAYGVPYANHSRRIIVEALGAMRKLILNRVGAPPCVLYERAENTWPFTADGKVKL